MPAKRPIAQRPLTSSLAPPLLVALASAMASMGASAQETSPLSATDRTTFDACVAGLRPRALAAGVGTQAFDRHVTTVEPDLSVLGLLDAQPEFTTPIWDYLAVLVDQQRVDDGLAMLARHAGTLARVEQAYGVDPATVVAVWGVESDYGKTFGKRPLLQSLSTLSCFGRRQSFFRSELFATLVLIQDGHLSADGLTGSWAGAFGHTQFMPSTYARIAVDFDGDGRRDLVGSIDDALASTANYLKRAAWRRGEPWGVEVTLPPGFDTSLAGRRSKRALGDWVARGIRQVDGRALTAVANVDGDARAALLLPAGAVGPAFIVFRNFDAIYSYNAAESYALAIAHLADRLRGGRRFAAAWPTDDPALDRAGRRELQELLLARGHAIGEADGLVGTMTRRAIVAEQQRLQHVPSDGRPGTRILVALRGGGMPAAPAASNAPVLPPRPRAP